MSSGFFLIVIIINILLNFLIRGIITKWKTKYISLPSNIWLRVEDYPIPEDLESFIAFNGEKVSLVYYIAYNKKGERVTAYDNKKITHWQMLPKAPTNK